MPKKSIAELAAHRVGCTVKEWTDHREAGELWCYCCKTWLPIDAFGADSSRSNGKASACRSCTSHKGTASRYQIALETARELRSGDSTCNICGRQQKLEVDHNHSTGAVRGVLCSRCNGALGQFLDSIDLLEKAIAYLRQRD